MRAPKSVKTMCERSSERCARTVAGWGIGWCAAALFSLLAACGTTPSAPGHKAQDASSSAAPATPIGTRSGEAVPSQEPLPPEAVQRFDAALTYMSTGDLAAAEEAFRALAAEYPSYSGPLVNLGILAAKAGRLEEAEKALQAAIERNAHNAAAFNQIGIVYRKLGRFEEADWAYQQALRIDPHYANAYLNLGVLCDLYLQQPQRALEAYERYLELAASPDAKVSVWVEELRRRLGAASLEGNE